jgi:glycerophosphoryl diester phosphodiesterase
MLVLLEKIRYNDIEHYINEEYIMIIFGHRGARGLKPENTLPSFTEGLMHTNAIELDVYACKTGELVVIHDDTVDRTTNGHGYVTEMTFDQLRKLDAGAGAQIPTLQEVLDLAKNTSLVNIELKGPGTATPVAGVIKHYVETRQWTYENFIASSFNHVELAAFKKICSEVRIAALICGIPLDLAQCATILNAYALNPSLEFISQDLVDDAHNRGLKVFVYTVNTQEDLNRLNALGVDGIFTDYPDRIK